MLLIMHRLGEYPFGFDGVLTGFDLTFVMSVSKSYSNIDYSKI